MNVTKKNWEKMRLAMERLKIPEPVSWDEHVERRKYRATRMDLDLLTIKHRRFLEDSDRLVGAIMKPGNIKAARRQAMRLEKRWLKAWD